MTRPPIGYPTDVDAVSASVVAESRQGLPMSLLQPGSRVRAGARSRASRPEPAPPRLPDEMLLRYADVPEGRIRTRVLGRRQPDALPVVVIQGMAVSDYLLPACAALGSWTEVHLFDIPGFGGSGRPTRRLNVRGYGEALVHWLEAAGLDRTVVVGHSSGTQVAAWAGVLAPDRVAAVGLASPT